jgi:hypothetical protein
MCGIAYRPGGIGLVCVGSAEAFGCRLETGLGEGCGGITIVTGSPATVGFGDGDADRIEGLATGVAVLLGEADGDVVPIPGT